MTYQFERWNTNMTHAAKAELCKTTITHLYSKEGRSKSYIAKLLDIDRKVIQTKIKEWQIQPSESHRHLTPSNQKFLNKNKQWIKSMLDKDETITHMAKKLKIDRRLLTFMISTDNSLLKSYQEWQTRADNRHQIQIQKQMQQSSHNYDYPKIKGERWIPILGFEAYEISDYGRVRHYATRYKNYYLMVLTQNKDNNRLYVRLTNSEGKSKNLQVANLVAHAFVQGYDETHNTVNHEDGNVQNNYYQNLSWTSQSKNNEHAYRTLHRTKVTPAKRKYHFDKIVYQDKYEFKTVAALARFINKSETQTRRYLDHPEQHNLKLIRHCND